MLKIGHEVFRPGKRPEDPQVVIPVPEELETVPGIPTNRREVDWYAREYPLESYHVLDKVAENWAGGIRWTQTETREMRKEHAKLDKPVFMATRMSGDLEPTGKPSGDDVSQKLKDKARELGFCDVGITAYDHRYTYRTKKDYVKYPHAVCLTTEQDYEATQTLPSVTCEIVHAGTYLTQASRGLELAEYIRSLGYHAQVVHPSDDVVPVIPMHVAAGLGQLGACGYLLTPNAGNRLRCNLIATDAHVTYDQPVDYGIHAFCQICQVCVNRCPGRALMRDKIWWRGVEKNKLYKKRCRPVMARYQGCAVCMKVCPIQKYGMATVMQHYAETGQVLGKGTHDLEGYDLPGKGYFGPGEMPVFEPNFFTAMPDGLRDQYAMERLKENYLAEGNKFTDQMVAEFRKDLVQALSDEDPNPVIQEKVEEKDVF